MARFAARNLRKLRMRNLVKPTEPPHKLGRCGQSPTLSISGSIVSLSETMYTIRHIQAPEIKLFSEARRVFGTSLTAL
ncbi:hypothetical protein FB556_0262 [Enteractinococcus coprophilus]|uniref:Uncharacterized protein n=1 Tax=Enteractinococcus coprophilus TaxID=1027633 RepID=A0A543AMK7_9MICC|nr:hypothetical protein FB556_0262 [Enteractinococcus coprophilus]